MQVVLVHLPFNCVSFKQPQKPSAGVTHLRDPLPSGCIVVTSQRMLLLCLNDSASNAIENTLEGYAVNCSFESTRGFLAIDIEDILDVHLRMKVRDIYE